MTKQQQQPVWFPRDYTAIFFKEFSMLHHAPTSLLYFFRASCYTIWRPIFHTMLKSLKTFCYCLDIRLGTRLPYLGKTYFRQFGIFHIWNKVINNEKIGKRIIFSIEQIRKLSFPELYTGSNRHMLSHSKRSRPVCLHMTCMQRAIFNA